MEFLSKPEIYWVYNLLIKDRGNQEELILLLMAKLTKQALKEKGRVVALLGNHEIMNLVHNFKDVNKNMNNQPFLNHKVRETLLKNASPIGLYLRNLRIGAKVQDTIFFHGI
jgi:hypothetical protein